MADKPPKKQEQGSKKEQKEGIPKKQMAILLVFVAIVIAVAFTLSYNILTPQGSTNFTAFWNSFASAPRAGIFISYQNATVFASALPCATALIQRIQESSVLHRNSSTMDFYIVNSTSCSYSRGLGSSNSSALKGTVATCLQLSSGEPHIVIQYSARNSTNANSTVLTITGSPDYLQRCGIASEITSK